MPHLRPVLLVEDSPNDIELTLEALERSRLANPVVVARDGVEALDYLFRRGNAPSGAQHLPAVVLLDIKLPRVDGLEVLERIRREPRTQHVPVVILTSSREEQDLIRSYNLGVNAFVVKPVGHREFFEAIHDIGAFWAVLNEPHPGLPGDVESGGDA
ncbi:response regulator [Paracraurococcus ruber]|uniref:Two-component system response regulator n=1 Tax=Paracraurococcus ruber TaxID=77675 RepID=A0ABS1CXN4_9PROT|nr:response regulator [Paracraurococcus ruber]MBK1659158.1 two-component system response regulator [Paracraurococcus ruber]TDG29877.1 response regulator [Paracraurococcus ruber]